MEISKTINNYWPIALALGLILFGIGWRLVPHLPNFAPIGAIALLAGVALGWRTALWLTLSMLVISDFLIGFYTGIQWTWLGFGLIIGLGIVVKKMPSLWRVPIGALGASIVFFIVSNFGTWLVSGMYSHDFAGLIHCYTAALPFFRATLLSDLSFGALLLGTYEIARVYVARHAAVAVHDAVTQQ